MVRSPSKKNRQSCSASVILGGYSTVTVFRTVLSLTILLVHLLDIHSSSLLFLLALMRARYDKLFAGVSSRAVIPAEKQSFLVHLSWCYTVRVFPVQFGPYTRVKRFPCCMMRDTAAVAAPRRMFCRAARAENTVTSPSRSSWCTNRCCGFYRCILGLQVSACRVSIHTEKNLQFIALLCGGVYCESPTHPSIHPSTHAFGRYILVNALLAAWCVIQQ